MNITESQKSNHKVKYSVFGNFLYMLKLQFSLKRSSILLIFLNIPLSIALSFFSIYIPKQIVQAISTPNSTYFSVINPLIFTLTFICLLKILTHIISTLNFALLTQYRNSVIDIKTKKCLSTDYDNLESPKFRMLMDRADEALWGSNNGSAVERMVQHVANLICSVLSYILFGSVLSFAHPVIVVFLTLIPLINYYTIRKIQRFQYDAKDETVPLDKKMWYISTNSENFRSAKDIRIFGLNKWLLGIFKRLANDRLSWSNRIIKKEYAADIVNGLTILIRDGLAYIILIIMVCGNKITIDNFVLYFAAVGAFTSSIGGIVSQFSSLNSTSLLISDLRDFLDYPEKEDVVENTHMSVSYTSIRLDDVSFNYPGSENYTLKNISLNILPGEKVAIVGLNGAGKTTLVKIICGLYRPTSGNMYIGDIHCDKFSKTNYYRLFSVIFQDFCFLPVSFAEIVSSFEKPINQDRVIDCIKKAGLYEKISSLPEGIYSKINKQINATGVELSGGEYQKLLLARALYKNSSILILDEPTAALDPIAEKEFYEKYDELFDGMTAIFISHRLSTTTFCDKIIYIKDGEICEVGTHKELLRMNGEYAKLYNIQKTYYVSEEM